MNIGGRRVTKIVLYKCLKCGREDHPRKMLIQKRVGAEETARARAGKFTVLAMVCRHCDGGDK